jgi:hypothetical protein
MMVKPISREPLIAACNGVSPKFDVADDVLEHDDRVVDDEADRERQRQQRQVVEAEAERVHRGEGADHRDRQGQRRDDRRRQVAQEQQDDQDDQEAGDDQRELHVVIALADRDAAVVERRHLDRRRQFGLESSAGRFLIERTVSMVLAPGWRWMASTMARLSTFQLAMPWFSTPSIGVATSSSGPARRCARRRSAAGRRRRGATGRWSLIETLCRRRRTAERLVDVGGCEIAFCSSSMPRSRAASWSGLAWMRTAYFCDRRQHLRDAGDGRQALRELRLGVFVDHRQAAASARTWR